MSREFDFNIEYRSLPNDVRHLEISIPSAKTSVCVTLVKTGSRNEVEEDEFGLHHLGEHTGFRGTKSYPDYKSWARAADDIGAKHNAEVEREYVESHVFGPPENTEKTIFLASELLKPTFPGKRIREEKNQIVNEIVTYSDNPEELAQEVFEKFIYSGSMSHSTLGTPESIENLNRRDLRKYMDKWYKGANVLVVTAGRIGRIRGVVDEYFGLLPPGPILPYEGTAGYGKPGRRVITTNKTGEAHFYLGFPGVPRNDERYYVLRVLAAMIGGSAVEEDSESNDDNSMGSSRLYQNIQMKDGHYDLSTKIRAGSDTGYIAVRGSVDPVNLEEVFDKIRKQIFGIPSMATKEEVKRARAFSRAQLRRDFENTEIVAKRIGIQTLIFDSIEHPRETLRKINAVRLDDVRRLAEEIFKPEEERLVVVGPVNDKLRKARKFNPH